MYQKDQCIFSNIQTHEQASYSIEQFVRDKQYSNNSLFFFQNLIVFAFICVLFVAWLGINREKS